MYCARGFIVMFPAYSPQFLAVPSHSPTNNVASIASNIGKSIVMEFLHADDVKLKSLLSLTLTSRVHPPPLGAEIHP